jgi:hypothetical protein
MGRATVALGGVISMLLAGCSTIVKGTDQQVSVNTPGVPGAVCQLQSPGHRNAHSANACKHYRLLHGSMLQLGGQHARLAHQVMTAGNVLFGGIIGLGVDAASARR